MLKFTDQYSSDFSPHKTFVRNDTRVSKKYYLDERGRLVAPNGTRYRLPSGPPEGRRPFQLDRSHTDKQPVRPYIPPWFKHKNLSRDSLFPEQHDANKLSETAFRKTDSDRTSLNMNKFGHLNLTSVNKTDPMKLSPAQQVYPSVSVDLNPGFLQSVDWNVVLLTLILSSISFICNVTLLVFLSWKVCQAKRHYKHIPSGTKLTDIDPQSWRNLHCETHPGHSSRTELEKSLPPNLLPKCRCVFEITGLTGDPNLLSPLKLSATELHSWCSNHASRLHQRSCHLNQYPHSKRKRKIQGQMNRARPHPNRRSRSRMNKSWIDYPNLGWLERFNQLDKGSNSGGSWQMIASDGVISESTVDEADSTPESTNNSDILYEPNRMRFVRRKIHRNSHKLKAVCTTISDPNLNQPANFVTRNRRNPISESVSRADSNIGRDLINENCPGRDREGLSKTFDFTRRLYPVTACRQNRYVCYTLGIHLGVLGALLSLIQILAICIALNHRIRYAGQNLNQVIPTTEIVCLISNSLAADTMLCARFYLIIAFVIVTLSALYINWIRQILQHINWMNDIQLSRFCFFTNSLNCLDHQSIQKHVRNQQNFAFIALMHSLPWASAAGTALLIAFSFFTKQSDMDQRNLGMNKPTVNIFFDGLNSLLSCSMKTISRTRQSLPMENIDRSLNHTLILKTTTPTVAILMTNVQFTALQWIYPFLLIIIPICLQLLFLFIYFIFVYRIKHRICAISKSLNQFIAHRPLLIIILLVIIETLSSGIPVIKNFLPSMYFIQSRTTQNILSRLIITHLLIDPWLIGCILQLIFKLDQSDINCTNFEQIYTRTPQTMIPSVNNLENLNERKVLKNILPIPNMTPLENTNGHKPEQSGNFLNCFPMASHTSMTDGGQSVGNRDFQPVLMSCLPTPGLFVSTLNPHPDAKPDAQTCSSRNSPGYLYPIADSTIKMPSPIDTGVYQPNFQDLTLESNPKLDPILNSKRSIMSLSIRNPNLKQRDDLDQEFELANKTAQDMYPQLCQHHQRLLEQQQNHHQQHQQKQQQSGHTNSSTISKRGRNFSSVPRFNHLLPSNFNQSTNSVKIAQDPKPTTSGSAITSQTNTSSDISTILGTMNIAPTITSSTTPTTESGSFFHRPLTGKSTATAAVMAAAAAAVAAQAGSLPRALGHHTSSSLQHHQETFPIEPSCTLPTSSLCDIVLKTPDISDSVRKCLTGEDNVETHLVRTE